VSPPAEGELPKEPAAADSEAKTEAKPEETTAPVEEPKPEEPAVQEYESKERHRQT